MGGRVGVEIEVNANSAPNWVGIGAGAELGNNSHRSKREIQELTVKLALLKKKKQSEKDINKENDVWKKK